MSYKITLYKGEPVSLKDEQGKQVLTAWANDSEKIIVGDIAIACSNIASITKTEDEPDFIKLPLLPPRQTNERRIEKALNDVRANLESRGFFSKNSTTKDRYLEACRKKEEEKTKL